MRRRNFTVAPLVLTGWQQVWPVGIHCPLTLLLHRVDSGPSFAKRIMHEDSRQSWTAPASAPEVDQPRKPKDLLPSSLRAELLPPPHPCTAGWCARRGLWEIRRQDQWDRSGKVREKEESQRGKRNGVQDDDLCLCQEHCAHKGLA